MVLVKLKIKFKICFLACEEVKYLTEDGKGKTEDQLLKDCSKSDSEFGLYFCEGACQARYKSNLIKANCANNKCTCDYCVKTGWQHDS